MKIAYISYEYPPDTAFGGVATYVYQAARMMAARGHLVEVFSASHERAISEVYDQVQVHRVECSSRVHFADAIFSIFSQRQDIIRFDVVESPEYSADARIIRAAYPQVPLVVKLHTPWFLIYEASGLGIDGRPRMNIKDKLRFMAGGLIRGTLNKPYWVYKVEEDPDYRLTVNADLITTPSISLGDIVAKRWNIDRHRIIHLPYAYVPDETLLEIPIETDTSTVTFLGRLEVRKGILDLCKAIPLVVEKNPHVIFRLVGKPNDSPIRGLNMREYLEQKLSLYKSNIEFSQVSLKEIPQVLSNTDICVFPSRWENFPNVCLEAMSAGRGIVGSESGGMKDMLEDPPAGLLIPPKNSTKIAAAIDELLNNKALRYQLGRQARKKVLETYSAEKIGDLMEKYYLQAMKDVKKR